MGLIGELRARARFVVGPAIGVCAVGYFAYHGVHGSRGLLAWQALELRVAEIRIDAARLAAERQRLERRVRLLHPESLDPDMLDEASRRMLNVGRDDERVIFLAPPGGR